MTKPYYPDKNSDRAAWWDNVESNAQAQLAMCGFTGSEITAIRSDAAWGAFVYRTVPDLFAEVTKQVTGWLKDVANSPNGAPRTPNPVLPVFPSLPNDDNGNGFEARRILWVGRLKSSASYSAGTIGAAMRTEPTGTPFDPTNYQAVLKKLTATDARTVKAEFAKAGGSIQAMRFAGSKAGSAAVVELGSFTTSPATLTVPVAAGAAFEEWTITARALIADLEIGLPSAALSVVVRG